MCGTMTIRIQYAKGVKEKRNLLNILDVWRVCFVSMSVNIGR